MTENGLRKIRLGHEFDIIILKSNHEEELQKFLKDNNLYCLVKGSTSVETEATNIRKNILILFDKTSTLSRIKDHPMMYRVEDLRTGNRTIVNFKTVPQTMYPSFKFGNGEK